MCGLAGVLSDGTWGADRLRHTAEAMAATLRHRGPDDEGSWVDEAGVVAFGFRRLAIIDLSEQGHQPMISPSGRYVLAFNGEIYNHRDLRRDLASRGNTFRGHSDTEVLLTAVEEWGLEAAVPRLIGMFAFALWDSRERHLHLVRDRLGIKPLYVAAQAHNVYFGSELKAILEVPTFRREVDLQSLTSFLRYLHVPAPRTILKDVIKIPPGGRLTLSSPTRSLPDSTTYWSLHHVARVGREEPFQGSTEEVIEHTETLLRQAVHDRMYADVPIGAFLSGGIDSSLVVSLMQEYSDRPVHTYSVSFEEEAFDEADYAGLVAAELGTNHRRFTLTGRDALDVVPDLPRFFDEPFASPSAIPNHLLCKVARDEVTVALSGTGGDEIFAGYNRYIHGRRMIRGTLKIPSAARRLLSSGFESFADGDLTRVMPSAFRSAQRRSKVRKVGELLAQNTPGGMYRSLISAWQNPTAVVRGATEELDSIPRWHTSYSELLYQMLLHDQLHYLPDDQLTKIDRVSMAVNLEVRVPLLDHRLVEFSWQLPDHMKVQGSQGKQLLRQVLYRRVPRSLVDRPKMGLSVPLETWLRGPLREWGESLVGEQRMSQSPYFEADPIRRAWRRLQDGAAGLDLPLWTILMFQAWSDTWLN